MFNFFKRQYQLDWSFLSLNSFGLCFFFDTYVYLFLSSYCYCFFCFDRRKPESIKFYLTKVQRFIIIVNISHRWYLTRNPSMLQNAIDEQTWLTARVVTARVDKRPVECKTAIRILNNILKKYIINSKHQF